MDLVVESLSCALLVLDRKMSNSLLRKAMVFIVVNGIFAVGAGKVVSPKTLLSPFGKRKRRGKELYKTPRRVCLVEQCELWLSHEGVHYTK